MQHEIILRTPFVELYVDMFEISCTLYVVLYALECLMKVSPDTEELCYS